jgi:hypothetical protein
MNALQRIPRAGWFLAGLAAALIIVPSAAVASTLAVTSIAGPTGLRAGVTTAGQLLTAPAAPLSFKTYEGTVSNTNNCVPVTPVLSSTRAYVLEGLSVDFYETAPETVLSGALQGTSIVAFAAIRDGASCLTATFSNAIATIGAPAGHTGTVVVPIDPGFVVPPGYQIYADGSPFGTFDAYYTAHGYFVPSTDAPSTPS